MAGKKVIIRTLDIGADKQVDISIWTGRQSGQLSGHPHLPGSEEIFRTQLRAIYRATRYGNIAVMYPMIISVKEVREAKAMAAQVQRS